jgi:hypothetical protein
MSQNHDTRVLSQIWFDLLDSKFAYSGDADQQDEFLDQPATELTNRQLLSLLNEVAGLRVAVAAMQEELFPNGRKKDDDDGF